MRVNITSSRQSTKQKLSVDGSQLFICGDELTAAGKGSLSLGTSQPARVIAAARGAALGRSPKEEGDDGSPTAIIRRQVHHDGHSSRRQRNQSYRSRCNASKRAAA
ncbi:hypothetical protein ACNKHN_08365 [Shigella flexneri]